MDSSFFQVRELAMAARSDPHDALGEMYRASLGGCLIRGFVPAPAAAAALRRLEAGEYPVPMRRRDPEGRAQTSGFGLGDTVDDLAGYTAQTAPFHEHFPHLFREVPDIEARFEEVLERISGGRRVRVAGGPDGAPYLPMLIRRAAAGCGVPPHFELQVLASASYAHLKTLLDTTTLISFYFQLALPESGGELYVHDVRWEADAARVLADGGKQLAATMAQRPLLAIHPAVGDLIFFDSGRYVHRVSTVEGTRARYTIGGFLGLGADGATVHYWA